MSKKKAALEFCLKCRRRLFADDERGICVDCDGDKYHSECLATSRWDAGRRCALCNEEHGKLERRKRVQERKEVYTKRVTDEICMVCFKGDEDDDPLYLCENDDLHQQHLRCVRLEKPTDDSDEEWNCDKCQSSASRCRKEGGCTVNHCQNISKLVECVFCHQAYHWFCIGLEELPQASDWGCSKCEGEDATREEVAEEAANALAAITNEQRLVENDEEYSEAAQITTKVSQSKNSKKNKKKQTSKKNRKKQSKNNETVVVAGQENRRALWKRTLKDFSALSIDNVLHRPCVGISKGGISDPPPWPSQGPEAYKLLIAQMASSN
jgi:hypothetical protein